MNVGRNSTVHFFVTSTISLEEQILCLNGTFLEIKDFKMKIKKRKTCLLAASVAEDLLAVCVDT